MSTVAIRISKERTSQPSAPAANESLDDDYEFTSRSFDWSLVAWLAAYTRPYARKRNLLVGLVILRAIQLGSLAWTMGAVINGPISAGSVSGTMWGTLGFLTLAAFTHFTFHFRYRLALELGEAVLHDLRNDIFAHLQQMPMSFFNRTRIGRIISRMTSDSEAIRVGVQDVLFASLVGLGQMVVAAMFMFRADRVLFLVVVGMVPVLWTLNRCFRRRLTRAHRNCQESFSRVTASVAESIQGIHVIQGSVREETNARQFRDLVADHSRYNLETARTAGFFLPLLEFNSQLFLSVLILLGGWRVLGPQASMTLGSLIEFLFLANIFFQPVQTLGDQYNQSILTMAGAERLRRLLSTPPGWVDPPDAVSVPRFRGQVRFENVTFGYEPDRPVLRQIDFTAEPGQIVAFVGHTGSGKSSLVNLIARFYHPTAGRVTIDGIDLTRIESRSLYRQIGIVLQQNFLFTGTVMENVRFGRPDATDAEVVSAIERLGCLDLLESLPDGLDTEVGECGSRLSLGQRQLVCFARAMLADPRILLLDEATSSIDVFTENRIQQALGQLLKGRTSFVVAHRLSTIRNADLVLSLDQGRIVARGTPAEVLVDELGEGLPPSTPRARAAA